MTDYPATMPVWTDESKWREALSKPQNVTVEFMQMQTGQYLMGTPLASYQHLMATPHTSHQQYSEIETTRRKIEERQRKIRCQQSPVSPGCGFRYPHEDFGRFHLKPFRLSFAKFYRVPVFKIPYMRF
jgi:hypothetical protein